MLTLVSRCLTNYIEDLSTMFDAGGESVEVQTRKEIKMMSKRFVAKDYYGMCNPDMSYEQGSGNSCREY